MSQESFEHWVDVFETAARVFNKDLDGPLWARVALTDTYKQMWVEGNMEVQCRALMSVIVSIGGILTAEQAMQLEVSEDLEMAEAG